MKHTLMTDEEFAAAIQKIELEIIQLKKESEKIRTETDELRKENAKEFYSLKKESEKEINTLKKETEALKKENEASSKELDRKLGKMSNIIGKWTESFFQGECFKLFRKLGYHFDRDNGNTKFIDRETGIKVAEVDNWLENGEFLLAVEIKYNGNSADVNEHIEKLKTIRTHLDKIGEKRKLFGAVASLSWVNGADTFAQKNGLYVITLNDENMLLKTLPDNWEPTYY